MGLKIVSWGRHGLLVVLGLSLLVAAHAQQLTNGLALPESVASDGHRFFVSNQG